MIATVKAVLLIAPHVLRLFSLAREGISQGLKNHEITKDIDKAEKAIKLKNRAQAAKVLNEIHRDS